MLNKNNFYEKSFSTYQITPENYGSFLDSLLNMQLAYASITESLLRADCC